jgi:type IV secretion system protein VirD4
MNYSNQYQTYSRWASETEIISSLHKIDLNNNSKCSGGIPLFSDSGSVYVEDKDSHSLIIGSTGSKKTRLIGMPALHLFALSGESFIATDPKAELYERTQPLLKKNGYRIFVLNLRDPLNSNAWNPLMVPYRLYWAGQCDRALEFLTDMSNCMTKENHTNDPYWQNSASDLLTGLLLVLFE